MSQTLFVDESHKSCEITSLEWNCSNGNDNHSFCIRLCPNDEKVNEFLSGDLGTSTQEHSEAIKCKCKQRFCQWEQKGKPCFSRSSFRDSYYKVESRQTHLQQDQNSFRENLEDQMIELTQSNSNIMSNIIDGLNLIPENSHSETFNVSVDDENDTNEVESKLDQFLRDINLSNSGSMIFNLNYISKL